MFTRSLLLRKRLQGPCGGAFPSHQVRARQYFCVGVRGYAAGSCWGILEHISKTRRDDDDACKVQEPQVVLGLSLEASPDATIALQPGEESFDQPPVLVAS